MSARAMILALVAALFANPSQAQFSNQTAVGCLAAGFDVTQCSLCALDLNIFSSTACVSYLADFESGLSDNQAISTYKNAQWPGWVALRQSNGFGLSTIGPVSGARYGAIGPDQQGSIQFGAIGGAANVQTSGPKLGIGQLRYFSFACANPSQSDPPMPVACKINIQADCLPNAITNLLTDLTTITFEKLNVDLIYDPTLVIRDPLLQRTGMAYQAVDFSTIAGISQVAIPQRCTNYKFSAKGFSKGPTDTIVIPGAPGPVLLFDNMYFNQFYKK